MTVRSGHVKMRHSHPPMKASKTDKLTILYCGSILLLEKCDFLRVSGTINYTSSFMSVPLKKDVEFILETLFVIKLFIFIFYSSFPVQTSSMSEMCKYSQPSGF